MSKNSAIRGAKEALKMFFLGPLSKNSVLLGANEAIIVKWP